MLVLSPTLYAKFNVVVGDNTNNGVKVVPNLFMDYKLLAINMLHSM